MSVETRAVCRDPPLEILYRDDWLCAIAKPPGLLVHRTRLDRWERTHALGRLRDQIGRPVYPAHRLDKATGGVLLFALAPEVHVRLSQAFEAGRVEKRYLALVRGWPPERLTIDHPLEPVADRYDVPGATAPLAALTVLERVACAEVEAPVDRYPTSRYALVRLAPCTGRRHQLRRHLKHAGHPIIGDTTYGQGRHNRHFREHYGCHELLLAAVSLALEHPVDGSALAIRAPVAPGFAAVAAALGLGAELAEALARDPHA